MLLKTATLGCKVNQYETQFVREALGRIGYSDAAPGESADLVIVNTCTVTAESDLKSRKLIRRLARLHPQAEIVVMGCYATRAADEIRQLPQVAEVVTDKRDIPAFLERRGVTDLPTGIVSFGQRHRAYVKVQDGCRAGCAYCIIPKVRPYLLSRPVGEVLDEIRRLVDSGYREIVLTGIHLGHYGIDFDTQKLSDGQWLTAARNSSPERKRRVQSVADDKPVTYVPGCYYSGHGVTALPCLSQLVERIMQLDGEFRLRVSSMEAVEVSDELIELMCAFPKKLCPHLHLSMQSGSDEVLRRMRRRWLSRPFLERCEQVKAAIDRIALTTDVIVGFPGESKSQFAETCDMVQRIGFSKVHVFPFSPREGTEAATMPNQIPAPEKERRVTHLMQLAERLRADFAVAQVGKTVQVLFETRQNTTLIGTSNRYLRTRVTAPSVISDHGSLIDVTVTSSDGDELSACLPELPPKSSSSFTID